MNLGAMFRRLAIALGLALAVAGAPAAAQISDSSNFLKAVRERDGTKATGFLNEPGSTLIDSRDSSTRETALHISVQRRDELWTRFLLDRGANPNLADRNGVTPLALAASLGFVEGVELLLGKGAQPDVPNSAGETPLISAVHRRDTGMIRVLVAKGANPDRPDNSGRSARDYAMLMGASSGVLAEIDRGVAARKGARPQETYGPGL